MIQTGTTLTTSPPNNNTRITRQTISNINSHIADPHQQIQLLPGIPNTKKQQPNLFETNRHIINSNEQILLQQQNQIMSDNSNSNNNNNPNPLTANNNNNNLLSAQDINQIDQNSANQPQAPNLNGQPVIISSETQSSQSNLTPNLLNQQDNSNDPPVNNMNDNQNAQNFDQQQNGADSQLINPNTLANSNNNNDNNINQSQNNDVLNNDYVRNLLSQLEAQRSALTQAEMERNSLQTQLNLINVQNQAIMNQTSQSIPPVQQQPLQLQSQPLQPQYQPLQQQPTTNQIQQQAFANNQLNNISQNLRSQRSNQQTNHSVVAQPSNLNANVNTQTNANQAAPNQPLLNQNHNRHVQFNLEQQSTPISTNLLNSFQYPDLSSIQAASQIQQLMNTQQQQMLIMKQQLDQILSQSQIQHTTTTPQLTPILNSSFQQPIIVMNPPNIVQLEPYDGTTDVFEFIKKFKDQAVVSQWNEVYQTSMISSYLVRDARDCYNAMDGLTKLNINSIIDHLKKTYAKNDAVYLNEFQNFAPHHDQTIRDYASKLKSLINRGSDTNEKSKETYLKNKLISSLPMSIRPIIQLQESKLNYADLIADIEKIMVKFDLDNAETININKASSSESRYRKENQYNQPNSRHLVQA
jgi:hypothetical protein